MRGTRQALDECNEWGIEEEITKPTALGVYTAMSLADLHVASWHLIGR